MFTWKNAVEMEREYAHKSLLRFVEFVLDASLTNIVIGKWMCSSWDTQMWHVVDWLFDWS